VARLTTVITADGHFRKVGFDVLPRPGLEARLDRGALD
jgi:hypothetical protein